MTQQLQTGYIATDVKGSPWNGPRSLLPGAPYLLRAGKELTLNQGDCYEGNGFQYEYNPVDSIDIALAIIYHIGNRHKGFMMACQGMQLFPVEAVTPPLESQPEKIVWSNKAKTIHVSEAMPRQNIIQAVWEAMRNGTIFNGDFSVFLMSQSEVPENIIVPLMVKNLPTHKNQTFRYCLWNNHVAKAYIEERT